MSVTSLDIIGQYAGRIPSFLAEENVSGCVCESRWRDVG